MLLFWALACATTGPSPTATPQPAVMEQSQMQECTVRISPGDPIEPHLTDGAIICLEPVLHNGGFDINNSVEIRGEPGTILDGQSQSPVVQILSHQKQITLTGLTLKGGYGPSGGGIFLHAYSELTIDNCIFEENSALEGGAKGLYATRGTLKLNQTRFAKSQSVVLDGLVEASIEKTIFEDDLRISDGAKVQANTTEVAGVLAILPSNWSNARSEKSKITPRLPPLLPSTTNSPFPIDGSPLYPYLQKLNGHSFFLSR